jgi:hypothetical protein
MNAALDTLQIVKRLREAGLNDVQAEAVTNVVRDARKTAFGQLATKADVGRLAADIERLAAATNADVERRAADIQRLAATSKADLAAAIAEVKVDLIKWVVGIGFAQVAMVVVLPRLIPGAHP